MNLKFSPLIIVQMNIFPGGITPPAGPLIAAIAALPGLGVAIRSKKIALNLLYGTFVDGGRKEQLGTRKV